MRLGAYRFESVVVAAALVLAVVRPPAAWVERVYANGIYPSIDRTIRSLTGPVAFCIGDVLFVIVVASGVAYWTVTLAAPRVPAYQSMAARVRHAAVRTVVVLAVIFIWFEVGWALNYSRVPLVDKVVLRSQRPTRAAIDAFADRVIDQLSRDAAPAHREYAAWSRAHPQGRDEWIVPLEPSFEATIHRLGDTAAFAPVRVKPTIFQPFFAMSATSGFTDPWTHEVNIDAGAFFFERPMYYAHEWAHIAGFTDESEANFISAVACTRSRDPLLRYSGWMLVWFNLPQDVHLTHRIARLAYDDLVAVRERYRAQMNRRVADVSRTAYDRYLRSNGVKAGYASYQTFVRWMTGAEFDASGLPVVEPTPVPHGVTLSRRVP